MIAIKIALAIWALVFIVDLLLRIGNRET